MTLLELYKQKNADKAWFDDHASMAKGAYGRLFEYVNTNYRTQASFKTQFDKFAAIEGRSREEWGKQEGHGQELDKQRVVNMVQSKLFKKNTNGLYSRTDKGKLFGSFVNMDDWSEDESWLLNYLFILNGYYAERKNYIVARVKDDLIDHLLSVESLLQDGLVVESKKLLSTNSLKDALRRDFFYFHSFYNDADFLTAYLRAPQNEKEELARYIEGNLAANNKQCCISDKYQPSGRYNFKMLTDEVKVFLLTLLFTQTERVNLTSIYDAFVDKFNAHIADVDTTRLLGYLRTNKNVFDPIFFDVLELEKAEDANEEDFKDKLELAKIDQVDRPEPYIDETTWTGKKKIDNDFALRKKQARTIADYKCALETLNNCREGYFTAKTTGKNYVEVHHLVPREFRNDFAYSIEVLANYAVLCARCHKRIHLATDRERKGMINSLYNDRKDRLAVVELNIDLKTLYDYYKISD